MRRDAEHAAFSPFVRADAVTPFPWWKGASPLFGRERGRGSLRSSSIAHAFAPRLRGKRRRPPAAADGDYSCSGHAPPRMTNTAAVLPRARPPQARPMSRHPAFREGSPRAARSPADNAHSAKPVPSRPREGGVRPADHQVPPSGQAARAQRSCWLKQAGPGALCFFPASGKAPLTRAAGKGSRSPQKKNLAAHIRQIRSSGRRHPPLAQRCARIIPSCAQKKRLSPLFPLPRHRSKTVIA